MKTMTLDEVRSAAELARQKYEEAAAAEASARNAERERREQATQAWAVKVVDTYNADVDAATLDAATATADLKAALVADDLEGILAAYRRRVEAQEVEAALHERRNRAAGRLPSLHRKYGSQVNRDPGPTYYVEKFSDVVDEALTAIRADIAERIKAELRADQPPAPEEA